MKLKFCDFNDDEVAWIKAGMRQSREDNNKLTETLLLHDEPVRIAVPHKVFHLSGEQLLRLKNTAAFEDHDRQYLIVNEKEIIAVAGIVETADKKYSVKFNYGEYVTFLKDTLIKLESIENKNTYNFSIIKIPALYIMAVWLQAKNENLFMPFGTSPAEMESYKLYSEEEFFAILINLSLKNRTSLFFAGKEFNPHSE